jgi:hypothetical protein
MENLNNQFIKALQATTGLANNSYLTLLTGAVEKVSDASQRDKVLSEYNKNLLAIVSGNNFALDPDKTNEFAQILGEAHFYLLCGNKGITLTRVKEGNDKTPDFKFEKEDMYFEVKTLSVVTGGSGIKKSLLDSLDAQIDIEMQLKQGKRIATGISVVQPYGDKPYQKGKGTITAVIETLIEKTRQNIKPGQFPNDKSFLVLNLSIIPPFRTENYVLRPAYCDDYMFTKAISGELWMMAFAYPGTPVLCTPEFEGKPCVESILEKVGILNDPNFDMISGILFMIHPWRRDSEIWGLYNYEKYASWCDSKPEIIETLIALTKDNWNDDMDTNGWQLHGQL